MSDYKFWRSWPADLRFPYLFLLGLTLLTICWSVYEYLAGPDRAIPWQTSTDYFSIPLVIDQFSRLVHTFQVQASGYLITERFEAGLPVLSATVANIYLLLLAVAVVYFLTAITTLKRIPYAVSMLLFMLFAASLNTDALGLIQSTRNYFLIGLIVAYGLLTYYFHAFAPNTGFSARLLSIAALTALVAFVIYFLSSYDAYATGLHLIGHSSPAVLIAGFLFVLLVAFDNIQGMLWLNGQGSTPQQRSGAGRFVITGVLYLASLLFIFLAQTGYFQVDVSVITPFFLLVISFFTGLWGFRQRESVFQWFLPFATAGSFVFLSLAIMAFLGASYAFGTANDPVIAAFNSAVLLTHLAFGTLYMVYVMVNFGPAIHKRLPVYRVAYSPQRFPFFTVYIAGTILLVILLLRTNWNILNQTQSGYYNYLGDLYLTEGNDLLAERYYAEGNVYENNNVRSNLNLATIAAQKNYTKTEIFLLKRTLQRRPQEKMYARLANLYADNGSLFDALFTNREGLKRFPESYRLYNNMALLFSQTDLLDSVNFYLSRAQKLSGNPVMLNNQLALQIKNGALEPASDLVKTNAAEEHPAFQSNAALLKILNPGAAEAKKLPVAGKKPFDEGGFMLYYHQMLATLQIADTTATQQIDTQLAQPGNKPFADNLSLLKAMRLHYHSNRALARKTLEQLTLSSPSNDGYYFDLMGLWLMEENLPHAASDYFAKAKAAGYGPSFLHHPYALALAGQTEQANNEAIRVMSSGDPGLIRKGIEIQKLLNTLPNAVTSTGNDTLRAQLLQLYKQQLPVEVQLGVISSFRNTELKANSLASAAGQLIEAGRLEEAEALLEQTETGGFKKALPEGTFQRLQASFLLARKQYEPLLKSLDTANFGYGNETLKNYFRAVSLWRLGRPKQAEPYFENLPQQLPYHASAVIETADFFALHKNDNMLAYELLLSGLAYNPYSVPLLKAYIFKATELNLHEYAQYSLQKLSELVPEAEYATFKTRYEQKVANQAATAEKW